MFYTHFQPFKKVMYAPKFAWIWFYDIRVPPYPFALMFLFRSQAKTLWLEYGQGEDENAVICLGVLENKANVIFFFFFCVLLKLLNYDRTSCFFLSKDVIEYISKKTAGYFAFIIASFLGKHCSKNSNVRQFTKWILRKIYHKDLLLKHPSVTVSLVMRCNWQNKRQLCSDLCSYQRKTHQLCQCSSNRG